MIAAVSHRFLIPTHNKSFNQYLPAPKRSKIHETTTIGFVSTRRLQYAITCTATAARLDIYLVSIATWGFYMVWEPEGGFDDVAVIGSSMQIEWSRLRGFGTPYRRDISTGSFVLAVALVLLLRCPPDRWRWRLRTLTTLHVAGVAVVDGCGSGMVKAREHTTNSWASSSPARSMMQRVRLPRCRQPGQLGTN